jgi:UDP-N-acetylmuramoyl-tripeptide--D-alanyl-D-alanine ligase
VRLRASEVASAVGGDLVGADVDVDGVSIDSRSVRPGQLFVPIVDARDGHDFVAAAREAGAPAHLTSRPEHLTHETAILGRRFATAASERSFNTELGVPLTLANAPAATEAAVVEMGARGAGHIELLCSVAAPTIGVVTVVAGAHLEVFGTLDDVARAKGELIEALPAHGTAVLNADDERVAAMASRAAATVRTFGERAGDVRAEAVAMDDELCPSFRLMTEAGATDVRLAVRGRHQITNALAAATAALAAGGSLDDVVAGLGAARLSGLRMDLQRAASGALILNDSYNANPTSMAAALDALAALPARRRIAVLGVMAELGDDAPAAHRDVAARARELGIEVRSVAAPAYGVDDTPDIATAIDRLGRLGEGDVVLVKASRVAGLEALAQVLIGR